MVKKKDKKILKQLENAALEYEKAHLQSKEINDIKSSTRKEAGECLDKLQLESVDVGSKDATVLRVQKVHKKSVNYDDKKIMSLLKSKGKDILKRATKVVIDRSALDALYNEGVVTYDEVQSCITGISDSTEVRIQRVKGPSLKERL